MSDTKTPRPCTSRAIPSEPARVHGVRPDARLRGTRRPGRLVALAALVSLGAALVLTLGAGAALAASGEESGGVVFETELDAALERGQREGKLVLLDCWAEWCTYCHAMDERVWSDPELARLLEAEAIAVKAEVDVMSGKGLPLRARYDIEGLPLVLVLDPASGDALSRLEGYQEQSSIIAAVDAAREQLGDALAPLDTDDPADLVRLGARAERGGKLADARAHWERAVKLDPECAEDAADDALAALARASLGAEDPEGARELAERGVALCPASSSTARLLALVADAARAAGDEAGAIAALEELTRRFPEDARARLELAETLIGRGDAESAERALALAEEARAALPEETRPFTLAARALAALERYDDALGKLEEAIEVDPHDPDLRELRLRLTLAKRRAASAS